MNKKRVFCSLGLKNINAKAKIKIKKNFLIFREEAKELEKISQQKLKKFDSVNLDFSNVEFISRSFLDELLNVLAKEKEIQVSNLQPNLKKFFNKVKKTKDKHKLIH